MEYVTDWAILHFYVPFVYPELVRTCQVCEKITRKQEIEHAEKHCLLVFCHHHTGFSGTSKDNSYNIYPNVFVCN